MPKPDMPQNDSFKWLREKRVVTTLIIITFGIALFVILNNFSSVRSALSAVLTVFSPIIYGVSLAYLLNMPMRFLERYVFRKFKRKRTLSIALTYILALALVMFLLWQIVPQITNSAFTLYNELPNYMQNLRDLSDMLVQDFGVAPETLDNIVSGATDLINQSATWLNDTLPSLVRNFVGSVSSAIITGIAGIITSIYILSNKEKLLRQSKRLLYAFAPLHRADEIVRISKLTDKIFSGYIAGKLINSLIIGVICFVFMSVMNILYSVTGVVGFQMPYPLLVSIVIGITNIIPYFGPFIGTIPVLFIMVMISPVSALLFLAFIIILQQCDANILTPKILGKSTGLPSIWVFVGTIIGGGLFGLTGMLLGVPATAVLYTLVSEIVTARLRKREINHL